jgi:hypothetical protein
MGRGINGCPVRATMLCLAQHSGWRYATLFSDEADGVLDWAHKRVFIDMKREVLCLDGYRQEFFISEAGIDGDSGYDDRSGCNGRLFTFNPNGSDALCGESSGLVRSSEGDFTERPPLTRTHSSRRTRPERIAPARSTLV